MAWGFGVGFAVACGLRGVGVVARWWPCGVGFWWWLGGAFGWWVVWLLGVGGVCALVGRLVGFWGGLGKGVKKFLLQGSGYPCIIMGEGWQG